MQTSKYCSPDDGDPQKGIPYCGNLQLTVGSLKAAAHSFRGCLGVLGFMVLEFRGCASSFAGDKISMRPLLACWLACLRAFLLAAKKFTARRQAEPILSEA